MGQHRKHFFKVGMLILAILCTSSSSLAKHWDNGPLRVSANKHYLENGNVPFSWFGFTTWTASHKLKKADFPTLFGFLRNNGFTVLQMIAIGGTSKLDPMDASQNLWGNAVPFGITKGTADPAKPNPVFFDYLEGIIDAAANHNIYVALLPAWGKDWVTSGIMTKSKAIVYGEWIGNRFRNKTNIIWVLGGDMDPGSYKDVWIEMGNAIKRKDPNHLMTYHPKYDRDVAPFLAHSSSNFFHDQSWLDFNMLQSNRQIQSIREVITKDYKKTGPVRPTLDGEPRYFNSHVPPYGGPPEESRRQIYWAMLAGASGHTIGHSPIWYLDSGWQSMLTNKENMWATYAMSHLRTIKWFKLIPDQTIITSGRSSGRTEKVAAYSSEGDTIVVYFPTNSSATVSLSNITSKPVTGTWRKPTSKTITKSAGSTSSSLKSFIPPSGWEDGLLILKGSSQDTFPLSAPRGFKRVTE